MPSRPHTVSLVQFPDRQGGEWFGYLTQEGKVALDFKGGPFKGETWAANQHMNGDYYYYYYYRCERQHSSVLSAGFFHVPRCLYMCESILEELLAENAH